MGPPSRVGHTKNLFYNKMNLIHGFGKYNFFGGYRVPLGGSGGTRPPPGWPLWPLSPKAPLEIFLKPLKTFHSNPEKVPRPLVALALAKNLDTAGPRCVYYTWCGKALEAWLWRISNINTFLSAITWTYWHMSGHDVSLHFQMSQAKTCELCTARAPWHIPSQNDG